jgi:hypothetical protein
MFTYLSEEYSIIGIKPKLRFRRLKNQLIELASSSIAEISRLALKIVVMAREQGTGNREQEESFGRFYFSLHTFKSLCSPTYCHFY